MKNRVQAAGGGGGYCSPLSTNNRLDWMWVTTDILNPPSPITPQNTLTPINYQEPPKPTHTPNQYQPYLPSYISPHHPYIIKPYTPPTHSISQCLLQIPRHSQILQGWYIKLNPYMVNGLINNQGPLSRG